MDKKQNDFFLEEVIEPKVFDVYIYGKTSQKEIFISSLSSSSLEKSVPDATPIKAGKDNSTRYTLKEGGDFSLTLTDVYNRQDMFAKKMGTDIKAVGEEVIYGLHMPQNYTVSEAKKITLSSTPVETAEVSIYDIESGKMLESSKYSIEGNVVTFTELTGGKNVKVGGFRNKAKATDKVMTLTSDAQEEELYVVAEGDVLNSSLELLYKKQYIFPKCTMSSNYTINQKTKMEEVADETKITPLKDESIGGVGYVVYIYPEA